MLVANLAARSLLGDGGKLQGQGLAQLLQQAPKQLATVLAQRQEGVISLGDGEDDAQWLVSQKPLSLQGQQLRLLLLPPLTPSWRARRWRPGSACCACSATS